jgi:hypothetical protein
MGGIDSGWRSSTIVILRLKGDRMVRRSVLPFTMLVLSGCATAKPAPPPDAINRTFELSCVGLSTPIEPTGAVQTAGAAVCAAWLFYTFVGQPVIDRCVR